MRHFFVGSSLINLVAISLERTHATFRPFRHRVIKKWVYGFIMATIWVTSGLLLVAIVIGNLYSYVVGSLIGFCLFIICACYASIVVKICFGVHPQHHGAASRERKLTKTLFIVTVVSLLLWLPSAIFYLLVDTFPLIFWSFHRVETVLQVFYFANCLVNPILYAIRIPDFKRALFSLFHLQPRQVEIIPLGTL